MNPRYLLFIVLTLVLTALHAPGMTKVARHSGARRNPGGGRGNLKTISLTVRNAARCAPYSPHHSSRTCNTNPGNTGSPLTASGSSNTSTG
jgi:hypothetical protein